MDDIRLPDFLLQPPLRHKLTAAPAIRSKAAVLRRAQHSGYGCGGRTFHTCARYLHTAFRKRFSGEPVLWQAAEALAAQGAKHVIITLGEAGSIALLLMHKY